MKGKMDDRSHAVWSIITHSLVGMILGSIITIVVNEVLIEISSSPAFSVLFGIIFQFIGGIIIYRLFSSRNQSKFAIGVVSLFAFLVFSSGLFCFLLDKKWVRTLDPASKIPLYFAVGISLCFTVTFAIIDILNYALKWHFRITEFYILNSHSQICTVLVTSIFAGAFFGLLFGTLDVEDDLNGIRFAQDKRYTLPIGCLLGLANGMVNYSLSKPKHYYDLKLPHHSSLKEVA